jgi:hypothetical protein
MYVETVLNSHVYFSMGWKTSDKNWFRWQNWFRCILDVRLNGSLRVHHNKINLPKGPWENDAKDYHKPDCKPDNNRCICLEVVHPIHLFSPCRFSLALCLVTLLVMRSRLRCIDQTEGTTCASVGTSSCLISFQRLLSTCPSTSLTTA